MIGDIMLLIPGLMSTNAIRDVLIGDTLFPGSPSDHGIISGCGVGAWIYGGNRYLSGRLGL